jgi:hypothetical protein
MRGLTDFLITVHVMKGLVGRGPVLIGLAIVLTIPVGVMLILIDGLYPGGLVGFALKLFRHVCSGGQ